MPTPQISIALLPFAKINFDYELATHISSQFRQQLIQRGYRVVGGEKMLTSTEEARAAAREMTDQGVDLTLVFQSTFTDNTMVLEAVEAIDAPVFLWAVPEDWDGGRLRLNSLCGVNLGSHALRRRGISSFYTLSALDDEAGYRKLSATARAAHVRRRLKGTRLGLIGEHPAGMDTCEIDPVALEAVFGVKVIHYDLNHFFTQVLAVDPELTEPTQRRLSVQLRNLDKMEPVALNRTLATYINLKKIAQEDGLDGLAIRCWPEFFTELGCSACGALSLAIDDGIACSCESDIVGSIGQLILQWFGNQPAYGVDLVGIDRRNDRAALWHCGHAPLSMAQPGVQPEAILHLNRKVPLLMQFALRPGLVTLCRISQATGNLRLVLGKGEILDAPRPFAGTSGVVRFERPVEQVLDLIIDEGLEHHLSFTYGDYLAEFHALAKMLNLPVLNI